VAMAVRFTFDAEKAVASVAFLASKNLPAMTKYKICKLVFLADKYHLVQYGRPITGDRFNAIEHGPIPSQTLDMLNKLISNPDDPEVAELARHVTLDRTFRYPRFRANLMNFEEILSPSDIDALNVIATEHGKKDFDELKALTHETVAYKNAWENRGVSNNPEMNFEDFFEQDADAIQGALEEMLENHALRVAFVGPTSAF
jgi:uncharacterized phage-associated protein